MSSGPGLFEESTGRAIPFGDISEVTLGRALESTVNILSTFVSRNQCAIVRSANNEWVLHDKSRFRSTTLNGRAIPEEGQVLKDNDKISFVYFKDMVYLFYSQLPSDLNPCKKRKMDIEGEEFNDIVPTQGVSAPSELLSELSSLKERLALKETELTKLHERNSALERGHERLTSLVEHSNVKAQEISTESAILKKEVDSCTATKRNLEEQIRDLKEVLKDAELEIERVLGECRCRLGDTNQPPYLPQDVSNDVPDCEVLSDYQDVPGSPFPFPEDDDPVVPLADDDFESPHCTINGKIVLDNELPEANSPKDKNTVLRSIVEVELDFMRTEVKEIKSKLISTKALLDSVSSEKEKLKTMFGDIIDVELVCSICSDVILEAVSLNCKHTFCKQCIDEWKKKKKDCPVCRTKIKSEVCPLLVDTFIDKVVELVGGELEQKRKELKAERMKAAEEEKRQNSSRKRKVPQRGNEEVYDILGGNMVIYNGGPQDAIWVGAVRASGRSTVVNITPIENANQYRGRRRRSRR